MASTTYEKIWELPHKEINKARFYGLVDDAFRQPSLFAAPYDKSLRLVVMTSFISVRHIFIWAPAHKKVLVYAPEIADREKIFEQLKLFKGFPGKVDFFEV